MRYCFTVTVADITWRSWLGKAEGTCDTELTPELPSAMVCRAAQQFSIAAEAGPSAVSAAAAVPAGLAECLTDGLGSLALLCNRVVHGATAAPWYQQQQDAAREAAACLTACKHQAAVLNSCLKLLVRLAYTADGNQADDMDTSDTDNRDSDDSADGGDALTAAGRWWAVKTAAAINACWLTAAAAVAVGKAARLVATAHRTQAAEMIAAKTGTSSLQLWGGPWRQGACCLCHSSCWRRATAGACSWMI